MHGAGGFILHPSAFILVQSPAFMTGSRIKDLTNCIDERVTINGWLYNKRTAGKLQFPIVRDGSGYLQCVVSEKEVSEETWRAVEEVTQESTVRVTGVVRAEPRAPGGVELGVESFEIPALTQDYPITPKDHGTAFLMDIRHLWLRSARQHAVLRVRSEIEQACRDFFYDRDFVLIDSPILTPAACEGTSTLFETDYFDDKAYLTQSGQLYSEATAAAFGKVYCFGPTFRAEKSKTRRHLMEFWMVEPEVAFAELPEMMDLAEALLSVIVRRVLETRRAELAVLERDTSKLDRVVPPFPRISYDEAVSLLQKKGNPIQSGDDFGGDEETMLSNEFDRPVIVHRYPRAIKAFYMQNDPARPELALCMDVLAPEGYGEIIGGGQRIHEQDKLLARIQEHKLPEEAFRWYVDLRRYGSVPHAGFGMGIERVIAWICGLDHVRETIPFPRMLYKLYP